jgi:hypothetical protein
MIIIIIAVKGSWKPKTSDAIDQTQGYGTNWFIKADPIVWPDFRHNQWFIVSENESTSEEIKSSISKVLEVSPQEVCDLC